MLFQSVSTCAMLVALLPAVGALAQGSLPAAAQVSPFDPEHYLADARWHDGCYGVSLREPAEMVRDGVQARWTRKDDEAISVQFTLPPPRQDGQPPEKLALKDTQKQLWENMAAGRGRIEALPQFGRDFLVNKRPCTVFYAVQQPATRIDRQARSDAYLLGVGILQVNPHCQMVLRLSRRIPAGARQEMPALEDARRRLEAMLGSVQTVPEAMLLATRRAQLERGAKALALLDGANAALPGSSLLRVRQGGTDIGWMRLEFQHQDEAWYRAHPPRAGAADGLCMPGLMVRVKSHIQSGTGKDAQTVDTDQEYFKADGKAAAPEMRKVVMQRAADQARANLRARGQTGDALEAAVQAAAVAAGQTERLTHESWQRVVTVREGGATLASSLELGFFATPSGAGPVAKVSDTSPVARLRVEWAGSTPPELANFFSNPTWRERLEAQERKFDRMVTERESGAGTPAVRPGYSGKDQGGALSGDRKLAQWNLPLDQPCLAQAHLWLMPWLLPKDEAQSCAFFCYSPQARQPGLGLFTVKPGEDGACDIAFRPAYDQPEQIFSFAAGGGLGRIRLPDGTVLEPTTVEEMARIWKVEPPSVRK